MLVLFIATNISLLFFLQMNLYSFWDLICLRAKSKGESEMYDYEDANDSSFCPTLFSEQVSFFSSAKAYSQVFLFIDLVVLLPVVTFLLFDNPHDCFTCLGKDPDRIYSSFQLSI